MTDAVLEFTEERGLGKVLGSVRLGSRIPLADGSRSRATLLLTPSGLWLVAARDRFHGTQVDLLTRGDLRLIPGRLRDQLQFGQEALLIPAGRRHAVERLLALARLASANRGRDSEIKPSRLVSEPDELGLAWLARELGPKEVLVCWLRGSNTQPISSPILGEVQSRPYLFVTERRAAIVAWSAAADVTYCPVSAEGLSCRAAGDQTELSQNGALFLSQRSEAQAARDASLLLGLDAGKVRLLEAARRLWLGHESSRVDSERSLSLLHAAIGLGSQRARFARLLLLSSETESAPVIDTAEVTRALAESQLTPSALAELWSSWKFSEHAGRLLVRSLLDTGALAFALALQRRVQVTPNTEEATARDELRLAHFAIETRLASVSAEDERARAVQQLLAPQGLRGASLTVPAVRNALPGELIEGALSHPLARGQGSLVAGVQKLIAQSPEPDHGALSDYCEALDTSEHPEARRALEAARLAFSLPALHAYVSRGKKSIGLRGYEAKSPYILLGKAHLEASSPFHMSEAELFASIGAEALHLKLGQARLTSHEVWAGAFSRTKGGLEVLLGLLPLLQGMPLGTPVAKFLERVPEPALRRGLEVLVRFERDKRKPAALGTPGALSHINENLLAAHRLMQMSADRAGLVLCGDLRASLRGLLLVRPDTLALLGAIGERDLVSVLLSDTIEPAMRADLTVRVASLLDFYLSDEYLTLRHTLCG